MNSNCLSYWFPLIEQAGVPVPRTIIVKASRESNRDLFRMLDGQSPTDVSLSFRQELCQAVNQIGLPCFLRTGQGSGKHDWERTCYLDGSSSIISHVAALIEWSETVDFIGLPSDVWVVRELLPVTPVMTCDRYGNMPVVREFRAFGRDGQCLCLHPYWPRDSLLQGMSAVPADFDAWYEALCCLTEDDRKHVVKVVESVSRAVPGEWSIDVLWTSRGWYVTDMARAQDSFHMPGCAALVHTSAAKT